MHRTTIIAIALLACAVTGPSGGAGGELSRPPAGHRVQVIRVGYAEPRLPADTRERIATCGRLAAMHAASAKSIGANLDSQNRVLDVAFMLCMTEPAAAE